MDAGHESDFCGTSSTKPGIMDDRKALGVRYFILESFVAPLT